jgi:hypothetical protein
MKWEDLSENALVSMRALGEFGPTVHAAHKQVKGTMYDSDYGVDKTYFSSNDLRQMAAGMVEVADWLDKRAQEAQQEPK